MESLAEVDGPGAAVAYVRTLRKAALQHGRTRDELAEAIFENLEVV